MREEQVIKTCVKCGGHGCPACIGTGKNVTELVTGWGEMNGMPNLKPEDHPSLPVTQQRELREFIRKSTS